MDGLIVLCTIPHTGTQFFKELIQPDKTWHITPDSLSKIENNPPEHLITTTREMGAVAASWRRRGKDMAQLLQHIEYWFKLLELHPMVVSIDTEREARLAALSRSLGRQFVTDWQPVNASNGRRIFPQEQIHAFR